MPKIIEDLPRKLTEEARRQVMEEGYEALNIRAVARNCGVGIGTVYNYFPSKDALIAGFMAEDWFRCLEHIRNAAGDARDAMPVLEAMHTELLDYIGRFRVVFHGASARMPAAPRQYHAILRNQLAKLLEPCCPDPFCARFAAEAVLTWTVEGVSFEELRPILEKVLQ